MCATLRLAEQVYPDVFLSPDYPVSNIADTIATSTTHADTAGHEASSNATADFPFAPVPNTESRGMDGGKVLSEVSAAVSDEGQTRQVAQGAQTAVESNKPDAEMLEKEHYQTEVHYQGEATVHSVEDEEITSPQHSTRNDISAIEMSDEEDGGEDMGI